MPVCPSGHTSEAADYCDVCGDLMDGAPRAEFARPAPAPDRAPAAAAATGGETGGE
ncbi:phosphopeptide-binding protein, partial [Actinomadura sp. 6K520]